MIARKRRWAGAGGMWISLLAAAGCGSTGGTSNPNSMTGEPVSRIPTWDAAAGVSEPEILPDTHLSAGRLHETHGRLARAAEQYRLAIGLRPGFVEAYNRLGIVLDRLGRFKEADDAFLRAIELAPNEAHLHNNLGFSFMTQSRWEDAEVEFTRAIELHPGFARAHVNLALVFARQDRFDEAMTQFQLAVPLADAHFNMGLMYQSKHQFAEAARAYKTALLLSPEMAAARNHLVQLPPDIVGAAEPFTTMQASPIPLQADAAETPARTQRPSTQPANTAPPGPEAPAQAEPPDPECLSLSIETRMDAPEAESSEPLWMSFDSMLSLDDPFAAFGEPWADDGSWTYEDSPYPPFLEDPEETIEGPPGPEVTPEPIESAS